jgi:polyhydroxybutyrate depolymerase
VKPTLSLLTALLLAPLAALHADSALVERQWNVDGVARKALVHIPPAATKAATPVVFVFHGRGGDVSSFAERFAIHKFWSEAIVVYPQGLPAAIRFEAAGVKPGWQQGLGDKDDRDLKFFDEMLGTLRKERRIDEHRIYVTGHSMGGAFTYLLWAARGDEFAAVASAAGTPRNFDACKPKPAMHIAGERDQTIPYARQQGTMEAVRKLNGCDATGQPWAKTGRIVGTLFPSKTGTPFVSLIHPGAHEYPTEASALIVKFFQEHPATTASVPAPVAANRPETDVNAKPGPAPNSPPVSASRALTGLWFSNDYNAGAKDASGQPMSGTETTRLLAHGGKLFASAGVWMDRPYFAAKGDQPWTGPQVLVKESARADWRVDVGFPDAIRVDAMTVATFTTDGSGQRLKPAVSLLVASPSAEDTATWTRDDATGQWTQSIVQKGLRGGLRSFCTHTDARSKIQYLFAGSATYAGHGSSGSIFRGIYDPSTPGKVRWQEKPELSGTGRVMCMAEADGTLYAACGIRSEEAQSGGLFRRVDGEPPHWELVWRWPHLIRDRDETEILRGLTAIPNPADARHEVLLGTCDYPGVIYRIDPARPSAVITELDIRAYFAKVFGVAELRGACLSAYNNFLSVTDSDTGKKLHLLGLWINHPAGRSTAEGASAWYLVRHADGTYAHGRVFDPAHARPNPPRGLLATRTIELSPFPEDKGRVLYFGGFDCAGVVSHNTAWIYKGVLPSPAAMQP